MTDFFVKKNWIEDDILFYLHFEDGCALRQIEITPKNIVYLSSDKPTDGDSFLYDQKIEDLDLEENDFISQKEFNEIWEGRTNG